MHRIIYALFFLSGGAGLVYQVVWSRLLNEIFGVTVYAVTTVLATFLAGLALGALILGRLVDRRREPLRLYGWLEIGIAVSALLGLWTIRALDPLHVWAANRFAPDSAALIVVRVVLASIVVLPPTFLMGGTLPAITRAFVDRMERFGRQLSFLYALNTLGAVVGTLATGFALIRWIGLRPTLAVAMTLNVAIGLVALLIARGAPSTTPVPKEPSAVSGGLPRQGRSLLLVAGLSGFVSLGLEVFWTRALMLSVGTTTYSFVTMLSSFLIGIALGSFIARRIIDRLTDLRRSFGWLQLAIAASVLAMLPLIGAGLTQRWLAGWGGNWVALILLRFGVSLLVMLVPTTLIGMIFPLAARIWAREVGTLGTELGQVYGAATLGNILGAAVSGFVLLPRLGLQKGIALLTVLNLAAAAWGLFPVGAGGRRPTRLLRGLPVLGLLAVLAVLLVAWEPAPFPAWGESPGDEVPYYREGLVGTVKVIRKARNPRQMWMSVDAIKIGESLGGVDHKQQALAHFPFLLMPQAPPRHLLSIGLGTGILVGEAARHPGVEAVDCLEISPSVIEAARLFEPFNHGVMDNPTVRVINDDGINFLRRTTRRYDAIISDAKSRTTHAANALFFSSDYYRLCRDHLNDDGLMIQWVPLNVPGDELEVILRTFLRVFPHGYVWVAPPHSCFLVGTNRPLKLNPRAIERLLADPRMEKLRRYGVGDAAGFVAALTADGDSLTSWLSRHGKINSLEHPVLEFFSPRAYAVAPHLRSERNLADLLRDRGGALATVSWDGPAPPAMLAAQRALGAVAEALRLAESGRPGAAARAVELLDGSRRLAPGSRVWQHGAAIAYRRTIEALPAEPAPRRGLAHVLLMIGRYDPALARFREALRLEPDDPGSLSGIATVLATHPDPGRRNPAEAVRAARRAVELTGAEEPQPLVAMADAYASAGRLDLAAAAAAAALRLAEARNDEWLAAEIRRRLDALPAPGPPSSAR